MADLKLGDLHHLKDRFEKYDLESTLTLLAGLLTIPALQANTIRLEAAVHLAAASCKGNRRPGRADIQRWLNTELARIRHLEDPTEDVFVGNVITPEGNRRVFLGTWEANDYYVEVIIDVLLSDELPMLCRRLLEPVLALLRISEKVAERLNLRRWQHESCAPQAGIRLPPASALRRAASAVCFSKSQLLGMRVIPDQLTPFILRDSEKSSLLTQTIGNTSLERKPLVQIGKNLVCALPHSISAAIRRYVVGELLRTDDLSAFADVLAEYQFQEVHRQLSRECRPFKPLENIPGRKGTEPSRHSLVIKYDIDKFLHVILIHERLEWIESQGFAGRSNYPRAGADNLRRYVRNVTDWCRSQPGFQEGTTLYVMGGLGGGTFLELQRPPPAWYSSHIGTPDFRMLTSEHDRPVMRYLKFLKQWDWIENKGFRFYCFEHYTLYCHWCQSGYLPVPRQLPLLTGSVCPVLGGGAKEVRAEVRVRVDRHLLPNARGNYWPVRRLHGNSLFPAQRQKKIYASPYSIFAGFLSGAVVTTQGVNWLIASTRPERSHLSLTHRIWEAFIDLFERLVVGLDGIRVNERRRVIEVQLDCSAIEPFGESSADEPPPMPMEPEVAINSAADIVAVRLPANFMHSFRQPENTGERLLLHSIAKGLLAIHGGVHNGPKEAIVRSLVYRVLEDPGTRVIHGFNTTDPVEIIRHKKQYQKAEFLSQMDYRFLRVGFCDGLAEAEGGSLLESKKSCNALLHKIVDSLVDRLRGRLQTLDRTSVIRELLERQEAIIGDRQHWNQTAKAVMALHSQSEEGLMTAMQREVQRVNAGLAARSIMEIAICECPIQGGRPMSSWDADESLALMLALLDTAACSEAIHHDLAEPRIEVFANGDFDMDHSFREQVMNPFLQAYNRERFVEAAQEYAGLYGDDDQRDPNDSEGSVLPHDLVSAFRAEFGLTPEQAGQAMGELIELAILQEDLVVETTVAQVKQRLIENCGYSPSDCDNFLRSFGLVHRQNWEQPPQGCTETDIRPWRYGRKLSAVIRPLFIFGEQNDDTIFYSVSMLRAGFNYLVGKIREGQLSKEFFTSKEMIGLIGKINDQLGHAFEKKVAERFRESGWRTHQRVPMSKLGAPAELGDIDVLAWKEDGQVRVIECKRLQLARSVAEIAAVCRKFSGEIRDELHKHLSRVEWIQGNPTSLKRIVGFAPELEKMEDWIVTSNRVPMTYLTSLPIEPGKFVPLPELLR